MYLGIDIGGTFIKYGIVNDENEIIKKWKKPTLLKENKDDFYDYICNDLEDYEFEYIENIIYQEDGVKKIKNIRKAENIN